MADNEDVDNTVIVGDEVLPDEIVIEDFFTGSDHGVTKLVKRIEALERKVKMLERDKADREHWGW